MKWNSIAAIILLILSIDTVSAQQKSAYFNDPDNILQNRSRKMVVVPVTGLRVKYINNSNFDYKRQFSDSFYVDAANSLLHYECSKRFVLCKDTAGLEGVADTIGLRGGLKYSKLSGDSMYADSFASYIKSIAAKYRVDLILVPYSCSIKYIITHKKGWRNQANTAGPVKYYAQTTMHIQIWDNSGKLLFENVGQGNTGRSRLYSLFKKRRMDQGIVSYANNLFSSPLVKSLYSAIIEAMNLEQCSNASKTDK